MNIHEGIFVADEMQPRYRCFAGLYQEEKVKITVKQVHQKNTEIIPFLPKRRVYYSMRGMECIN